MINTAEYLQRNKELSKLNTELILSSIEDGLNTISQLSKKVQSSDKSEEDLMIHIMSIKDISIDIILENMNMMKAAMDRHTIPNEDIRIPNRSQHIPHKIKSKPKASFNCFRKKISKDNLPSALTAHDLNGCDEDSDD